MQPLGCFSAWNLVLTQTGIVVLCGRKTVWSHYEMIECNLQLDRAHD